MARDPSFLDDYFSPGNRQIQGEQHGRGFSESYDSRFARAGTELGVPAALPAAFPGQHNLYGVDGGSMWRVLNQPKGIVPAYCVYHQGGTGEPWTRRGLNPNYELIPSLENPNAENRLTKLDGSYDYPFNQARIVADDQLNPLYLVNDFVEAQDYLDGRATELIPDTWWPFIPNVTIGIWSPQVETVVIVLSKRYGSTTVNIYQILTSFDVSYNEPDNLGDCSYYHWEAEFEYRLQINGVETVIGRQHRSYDAATPVEIPPRSAQSFVYTSGCTMSSGYSGIFLEGDAVAAVLYRTTFHSGKPRGNVIYLLAQAPSFTPVLVERENGTFPSGVWEDYLADGIPLGKELYESMYRIVFIES